MSFRASAGELGLDTLPEPASPFRHAGERRGADAQIARAHVVRMLEIPGTAGHAPSTIDHEQVPALMIFGRVVETFGSKVETPDPDVDRVGPDAADVANASLQQLIDRGLTQKRAESVRALARAAADGSVKLEPPVDFTAMRGLLQELPGIGPWTAEYIAMRALGDPDAFPSSDLGLLNALKLAKPAALQALAEGWRPFRAYAALHLWHGSYAGG